MFVQKVFFGSILLAQLWFSYSSHLNQYLNRIQPAKYQEVCPEYQLFQLPGSSNKPYSQIILFRPGHGGQVPGVGTGPGERLEDDKPGLQQQHQ